MPKENQDRDAIVSKAIDIASEEDRTAYVSQACNGNADLKHQVEERLAAHFREDKPSPGRKPEQPEDERNGDKPPKQTKEKLAHAREEVRAVAHEHPRFMTVSAILLLFLFVVAAGGVGMAVWEWHKAKEARNAAQQAAEKQQKAEKEAKEAEGKVKRSAAEAKEWIRERDQARQAERSAKNSEEELKAIHSFIKNELLSVGHPGSVSVPEAFWAGSKNSDVSARKGITLREAVDRAESKVSREFADRPLSEATVREMLGLAYLNLGEASKAVEQFEQAYQFRKTILGVKSSETADARNQLAVAYRLAGQPSKASRLFHHNPDSAAHADALADRGAVLLHQRKPAEAELKLRQSLNIRQDIQPHDWTTFETQSLLGEALLEQKKFKEAEPLLVSGYEGMKRHESHIPTQEKARLSAALERLVRLYEQWNKKDKEAHWQKELDKAKAAK